MAEQQAPKRARVAALEATVSTESTPGMGRANGVFVQADGARLLTTDKDTVDMHLPSAGFWATIAGNSEEVGGFEDGQGTGARFNSPDGITVDLGGDIVLADYWNHALRKVSKAGAAVSTLAGNGEEGFVEGRGDAARFNCPVGLVMASTGEYAVADSGNHRSGWRRARARCARWRGTERQGSWTGWGRRRASTNHRAWGCCRTGTWWGRTGATTRSGW